MHNKNPDAPRAIAPKLRRACNQTSARAAAATATAAINEPRADWVPLLYAPFCYRSSGYIRTTEEWRQYLDELVHLSSRHDSNSWSIEIQPSRINRVAIVRAMGLTTLIAIAGYIFVLIDEENEVNYEKQTLSFGHPIILHDERWNSFPPELQKAADWHRRALDVILTESQAGFGDAILSGAAHIVARKNTILNPFERVTLDQWQYFRLDEEDWGLPTIPLEEVAWHDPRASLAATFDLSPPSTATGRAGEKLYAIHVAPGVVAESTPEDKCQQWLCQLLRKYPERQPEPLPKLRDEAMSRFPGLSKRAFDRCVSLAKALEGRREWSKRGPPPKSPQ
jgi:hypothetical protein